MSDDGLRTIIHEELASIRVHTEGLPLLQQAVQVLQRDVREIRDNITVLTGIAIRLEGATPHE